MSSLKYRAEDVAYVAALQKLESHSPWTMTTGQDIYGDFFVSFVTKEFSERVTLKSSSRRRLTSLILLLVEHWEEMSLLLADLANVGNHGRRKDEND